VFAFRIDEWTVFYAAGATLQTRKVWLTKDEVPVTMILETSLTADVFPLLSYD
jgi:hypothetical protein